MAVAVTLTADDTSGVQLRPRLFTADEFERLVESGIFGETERVELIEGQIVEMNPIGPGHVWSVNDLTIIFARVDNVAISVQNPIRLAPRIQPQPDLVVLRQGGSRRVVPLAEDALLVIEVADTSLSDDRNIKRSLYARAGIPEYWIVDLNGERVEVYREPSAAGYRSSRFYLRGESLSPIFAPDLTVAVDAILGPVEAPGEADDDSDPA
jgi:Uma2 family endonuclease